MTARITVKNEHINRGRLIGRVMKIVPPGDGDKEMRLLPVNGGDRLEVIPGQGMTFFLGEPGRVLLIEEAADSENLPAGGE